ncbi:MAG: hypothetical protein WC670_05600 [Pseudolabrys sp.]
MPKTNGKKQTNETPRSGKSLITGALCAVLLAAGLIATPVHAQTAAPAAGSSTAVTPKPKRTPTPGQLAARERQKKCAVEWKADKAAGKVATGMKWPQYWSACNKRLKGAS